MSDWYSFDKGRSIGKKGSEAGVILRDEEHPHGSRITLERGGYRPFSITCGIYGWMVHTRFFSEEAEARDDFELMKGELAEILNLLPSAETTSEEDVDKVSVAIREFITRFP